MNEFEYTIERTWLDRTIWSCGFKKRLRCKARLITYGNTVKIMNNTHVHDPKPNTIKDGLVSQVVNIIVHK